MKYSVLWAIAALAAVPAVADTTYQITVSNQITAEQPICTVDVWAVYEPGLFAFAGAEFELHATPDPGGFSMSNNLLEGPGTKNGKIPPSGDSVLSVLAGQIKQLPLEPHLDFGNPIHIWRGKWTTTDFTPRTIELQTATLNFEVYVDDRFKSVTYLGPLFEGSGAIHVGCYADCDSSGELDLFDFLCFANGFNAGDTGSDCDGNSSLDLFDFLCFMNAFAEGC